MTYHGFVFVPAGRTLALETITGIVVFCVATMSAMRHMIAGQT
jgi:hypothetical protein